MPPLGLGPFKLPYSLLKAQLNLTPRALLPAHVEAALLQRGANVLVSPASCLLPMRTQVLRKQGPHLVVTLVPSRSWLCVLNTQKYVDERTQTQGTRDCTETDF